jgi:hypothetical protein
MPPLLKRIKGAEVSSLGCLDQANDGNSPALDNQRVISDRFLMHLSFMLSHVSYCCANGNGDVGVIAGAS